MTAPSDGESGAQASDASLGSGPPFIERSIAAGYRARSLESRAGNLLTLGIVCVLGAGLLAWYYGSALQRPAHAAAEARGLAASRAQAEMSLPPLVLVSPARPNRTNSHAASGIAQPTSAPIPSGPARDPSASILPSTASTSFPPWLTTLPALSRAPLALSASRTPSSAAAKTSRHRALDRRLAGPAFTERSGSDAEDAGTSESPSAPAPAFDGRTGSQPGRAQAIASEPEAGSSAGELARLLVPAIAPAVSAQVVPTRTLLLPKGAFIDCTLETAIDSTLPGMTTCITATDSFGADGRVVLLERGSKLVGETRGEVAQGSARVFVVWTEARTPAGVVIPLASPGTDELGRSGLPGTVNRHFFQRFGAALLISIIDVGAQAAAASRSGTVINSPSASQDVMSEVLKDTLRIPPTVVKRQGDRIQVLVARDLDFRTVYELRTQNPSR